MPTRAGTSTTAIRGDRKRRYNRLRFAAGMLERPGQLECLSHESRINTNVMRKTQGYKERCVSFMVVPRNTSKVPRFGRLFLGNSVRSLKISLLELMKRSDFRQ